MEWWLALSLMLGTMVILMVSGIPVAVAFLFVDVVGAVLFLGGEPGITPVSYTHLRAHET